MPSSASGSGDRPPAGFLNQLVRRPLMIHSGVYAALVLLHLLFALQVRYPTVFYDEIVYLGFARFFSGASWLPNLIGGGYGHFGYGLLTVPAFLVSSSFPDQFRLVLVINSVLISTCYLSLFFLLSRLTEIPRRAATLIAVVICLYPSYLLFPNFAISENAFIPLYLLVLVALVLFLEKPVLRNAALLGCSAGLCYMMHSRGLSVLLATGILAMALTLRRRVPSLAAAVVLLLLAGFYLVTRQGLSHIVALTHGAIPAPWASLAPLGSWEGWKAFLLAFTGEVVYLAQTTVCLYFAGLACILADLGTAVRDSRRTSPPVLAFIVVTVVAVAVGSAVFVAPQDIYSRPDHLMAGRYNEGAAPIVLAFSLVLLYRATREEAWNQKLRRTVCMTALALCGATLLVAPHVRNLGMCSINALGTVAFVDGLRTTEISRVTLLAVILTGTLFALHRKYGLKAVGFLAALFVLNGFSVFWLHYRQAVPRDFHPAALTKLLPKLDSVREISYDMSVWHPFLYSSYQLMAPRLRFVQFASAKGETPVSPVAIAGRNWKDAAALGYRYVAGETIADNSLWVSSLDVWQQLVGGRSFLGEEIGSRSVPGIQTDGIYWEEGDEKIRLRWTNGNCRIVVPLLPGEAPGRVAVELFAFEKTSATVLVNGAAAASLEVGPGSVSREIVLTPGKQAPSLIIEIRSGTFAPGRGDPRILGVQIRSVKVLR